MVFVPALSHRKRTPGTRFALSSLRERMDAGSVGASWRTDPDGLLGRVLDLPAGGVVTYPLALDGPVTLTARVRLYPHDWRDLRGAVCARVAFSDNASGPQTAWSASLRAGGRQAAGGRSLQIELPAGTTALHLSVSSARRPEPHAVRRAVWVDPALWQSLPRPAASPNLSAADGPVDEAPSNGGPLFSVLVPVHDPPVSMLEEAVDSVCSQTFGDWEICLVDDGSRDPAVLAALSRLSAGDRRIRVARHDRARGISAATNTALEAASGRYVALLDHDDTLAADALQRMAAVLAADSSLDMLYSDEDIVDGGRQVWVHLKPGWSPDTLRTNGYTCHLGVYRRSLVQEVGGFRTAFDGSQDIDMILRLTERSTRVAHVPGVLYHWRAHAASTAGGDAKPYAYVAARRAYAEHLERTGVSGEIGFGPPGLYRLATPVSSDTRVAIVLALTSVDGLGLAARTWAAQLHMPLHVVVAVPTALAAAVRAQLADVGIGDERSTVLETGRETAAALRQAADHAATLADHLLLLQSAVAGLTHDWLTRLVSYSQQAGIAAAGPVVLAPDGRVADAGVALPDGLALHLLRGSRTSMDDHFGYGTSVHNVSALSGAVMTPARVCERLGGPDPALRELALVDYCVRAGDRGQRVVSVPDVRLRMTGPDPAVNDLPALHTLRDRWAATHDADPFYNAGYRTDRGDFSRAG